MLKAPNIAPMLSAKLHHWIAQNDKRQRTKERANLIARFLLGPFLGVHNAINLFARLRD